MKSKKSSSRDNKLVFSGRGRIAREYKREYVQLLEYLGENNPNNADEYYRFGYECNAPFYYGFCIWLNAEIKKNGIKKVFFLSRDGYLIKKTFECCGDIENCDVKYVYVSRRSIHFPLLWMYSDMKEYLMLNASKRWTYRTICNRCGFDLKKGLALWEELGLDSDYSFQIRTLKEDSKVFVFLDKIRDSVIEKSRQEFNVLLEYLDAICMEGRIALVDSGGFGTIQRCLVELNKRGYINTEISGYYMWSKEMDDINYNCYAYDGRQQGESKILIEVSMTAMEGTTVNYIKQGESTVPNVEDFEYDSYPEMKRIINSIQNGTIYGVNMLCEKYRLGQLEVPVACHNINMAMWKPRMQEVNMFGDIIFHSDQEDTYLAKPKSIWYYLLHIDKLIDDFKIVKWKIGFVKRLLVIPLPYAMIVQSARKLHYYRK